MSGCQRPPPGASKRDGCQTATAPNMERKSSTKESIAYLKRKTMDTVDIYIETSNHSIKRTERKAMYLMSFTRKNGETVTWPPIEEINTSILQTEGTWTESEAETLTKALSCVVRPCEIVLHTKCPQTGIALGLWIPGWRDKGWKKSDGSEVPELYRNLAEAAELHNITVTQEPHEYESWMATQMKGENHDRRN